MNFITSRKNKKKAIFVGILCFFGLGTVGVGVYWSIKHFSKDKNDTSDKSQNSEETLAEEKDGSDIANTSQNLKQTLAKEGDGDNILDTSQNLKQTSAKEGDGNDISDSSQNLKQTSAKEEDGNGISDESQNLKHTLVNEGDGNDITDTNRDFKETLAKEGEGNDISDKSQNSEETLSEEKDGNDISDTSKGLKETVTEEKSDSGTSNTSQNLKQTSIKKGVGNSNKAIIQKGDENKKADTSQNLKQTSIQNEDGNGIAGTSLNSKETITEERDQNGKAGTSQNSNQTLTEKKNGGNNSNGYETNSNRKKVMYETTAVWFEDSQETEHNGETLVNEYDRNAQKLFTNNEVLKRLEGKDEIGINTAGTDKINTSRTTNTELNVSGVNPLTKEGTKLSEQVVIKLETTRNNIDGNVSLEVKNGAIKLTRTDKKEAPVFVFKIKKIVNLASSTQKSKDFINTTPVDCSDSNKNKENQKITTTITEKAHKTTEDKAKIEETQIHGESSKEEDIKVVFENATTVKERVHDEKKSDESKGKNDAASKGKTPETAVEEKYNNSNSDMVLKLEAGKNSCFFVSALHFIKHFITFNELTEECSNILKKSIPDPKVTNGFKDTNCPNHISCFIIKLFYKLKYKVQLNETEKKEGKISCDYGKINNIFKIYYCKDDEFYKKNKTFINDFVAYNQQDSIETISKLFIFFQEEVNLITGTTNFDENCLLKNEFKFLEALRKLKVKDDSFCIDLFDLKSNKNLQTRLEEIFFPAKNEDGQRKSTEGNVSTTRDIQTQEYIPVILNRDIIKDNPDSPSRFEAYDIPRIIKISEIDFELVLFIAYRSGGSDSGITSGHYIAIEKVCNNWYDLDDTKEVVQIIKENPNENEEQEFVDENNGLISAVIYKKKK